MEQPMDSLRPTRRAVLLAGAALFAATVGRARAAAPLPAIADMHSHRGLFRGSRVNLRDEMDPNGVRLVAWAIVDDSPWTTATAQGIEQKAQPAPGEPWQWFQRRVTEVDARLQEWKLPKALTPADVDAAMAGEPHVVLACEAANFLEGDASRLAQAHAWGVRHLQLVHYIASPLGDIQTAAPRHGAGLPEPTRAVIAECQRLGILLDLAHCAPALVDAALDASHTPMIWSHSWIRPGGGRWQEPANQARALSPAQARRIAEHGGVVGLWSVASRDRAYPVTSVASYADEVVHMVDLLGPRAVGFGTDLDGAGSHPVLRDYADLHAVVERLATRGLPDDTLADICGGNYARVLKQAMAGAQR
jgi:membrane dipeptidase